MTFADQIGMRGRTVGFALFVGLTLAFFWAPLSLLTRLAFQEEQYSHILLIPPVSIALLFLERRRIFSGVDTRRGVGLGLLFAGIVLHTLGSRRAGTASQNDRLALEVLSLVVIWLGGFALCYGLQALRAGVFPALFLFLMVPIPDRFLDGLVVWLQTWSAEVSYAVFQLARVPVLRDGLVFALPGVVVEVSKECSGIRSSLILIITSLLAGHLFLESAWTKAVFFLATIPMLIVKNVIRIITITLLSVYVDVGYLTGNLHRRGGVLFFLLAFAILTLVLWFLQKSEQMIKRRTIAKAASPTTAA